MVETPKTRMVIFGGCFIEIGFYKKIRWNPMNFSTFPQSSPEAASRFHLMCTPWRLEECPLNIKFIPLKKNIPNSRSIKPQVLGLAHANS